MKEYIRTTHDFNNETRDWEIPLYKNRDHWNDLDKNLQELGVRWSFGVHSLKNDQWRYMRNIIDTTIEYYNAHASDSTEEFKEFVKNNPNHREIIKQGILKEFEILIKSGDVRVREDALQTNEYWDN